MGMTTDGLLDKGNSMSNDHKLALQNYDKKITALSDALAKLASKDDFERLLLMIRKPGWTTIAEVAFGFAIVDHMTAQARAPLRISRPAC